MSARTSFISQGQVIPAGSTAVYKGQIVDENGAPVPYTSLTALTLSIVDTTTGAAINNVSQVSILSTGRGTVDSQGNLVVTIGPPNAGDTALEVATDQNERRSLIFDFTYSGGKAGRHQVNLVIGALAGP